MIYHLNRENNNQESLLEYNLLVPNGYGFDNLQIHAWDKGLHVFNHGPRFKAEGQGYKGQGIVPVYESPKRDVYFDAYLSLIDNEREVIKDLKLKYFLVGFAIFAREEELYLAETYSSKEARDALDAKFSIYLDLLKRHSPRDIADIHWMRKTGEIIPGYSPNVLHLERYSDIQ